MPPIGEAAWLATLPNEAPADLEEVVNAVEIFRDATTNEPYSLKIWDKYCSYLSSLDDDSTSWLEEEQAMRLELFSPDTEEEVWQQALRATKYRINDSHLLWNKWIARRIFVGVDAEELRAAYIDRLQVPHSAWDETSQQFSSWLSAHDEGRYEETMMQITELAKVAKKRYATRELWELKIFAVPSGSDDTLKALFYEYLDFEAIQRKKDPESAFLGYALYERSLLLFPSDDLLWNDYCVALDSVGELALDEAVPTAISTLQRSVDHCPSSQLLWSRYLVRAEVDGMDTSDIEAIMERAISSDDPLDISEAVRIYSAWCSHLVRSTSGSPATSAIERAIKNVGNIGVDPTFTLERCLIEYLTQQGNVEGARSVWKKLIKTHGHSYDFWQQYYEWEMVAETRDPQRPVAGAVLKSAIYHRGLDWPEKMLEMYSRHSQLFYDAVSLLLAMDDIHKSQKSVTKRRLREAAEAAAAYALQNPQETVEAPMQAAPTVEDIAAPMEAEMDVVPTSPASKRKREESVELANKKSKVELNGDHAAQELKRDRENTSVLVSNLPPAVTQTKIKQYFRDFGHINNVELRKPDDLSPATALIEFRDFGDVESALLRDGKLFEDREIAVVPGRKLTLYVTNFPIAVDEDDSFMLEHFGQYGEIFAPRWPNKKKKLMANQRRRFVYISYTTAEGAANALELDGKEFDDKRGQYQMQVKYSNPLIKKDREPSKKPLKVKEESAPRAQNGNGANPRAVGPEVGGIPGEGMEKTSEPAGPQMPPPPKFMQQAAIRRPVLGAPRKKRGGFGGS